MSPTEKGRFCSVCTKEVLDFTQKSQKEILVHLQHAEGKTCGLFLPSQLNEKHQLSKSSSPWEFRIKKWAVSLLAISGLFSLSKNTSAQKMGKVAIRGDVAYIEEHNTNTRESVVYGQVSGSDGKNLQGARVRIYSGGELIADTSTIANGTFRFVLKPGSIRNNKITVSASYNLFYKELLDVVISKSSTRVGLRMEEEIMMLGEVAYTETPETIVEEHVVTTTTCSTPEEVQVSDSSVSVLAREMVIDCVAESLNDSTGHATEDRNTAFFPEEEEKEKRTRIYPNPGKEYLMIECEEGEHEIELLDLNGKVILRERFRGLTYRLENPGLQAGVYILNIRSGEQVESHRWIIR